MKTQNDVNSGVFVINFENISHLFLVFLLSDLNTLMFAGCTEAATGSVL